MGWPSGWVEWVTAASGLGVLATVVGLAIAYRQLRATRTAAEAASSAAEVVSQQLASSRLMLHLSLARQVEHDLHQTRTLDDPIGAARTLVRWRIVAPTIRASLGQSPNLQLAITRTVTLARLAERRVSTGESPSVSKATEHASDAISETIDRINEIAEDLATSPDWKAESFNSLRVSTESAPKPAHQNVAPEAKAAGSIAAESEGMQTDG